jgi:hypothetical protein
MGISPVKSRPMRQEMISNERAKDVSLGRYAKYCFPCVQFSGLASDVKIRFLPVAPVAKRTTSGTIRTSFISIIKLTFSFPYLLDAYAFALRLSQSASFFS